MGWRCRGREGPHIKVGNDTEEDLVRVRHKSFAIQTIHV